MLQDLFIAGTGNVGEPFIKQTFEDGDTYPTKHENPTRVVGLASISEYIYDPKGLSEGACLEFARKKDGVARYPLNDLLEIVRANPSNGKLTFVDITPSKQEMKEFHLDVIRNTPYGIVTSNKNPVVMATYDEFIELTSQPSRYGFSCSVMAGAEAVNWIGKRRDIRDNITSIEGCFSGTLGYICSELQKGEKKFSEIVQEAYDKGFTETHPGDDLSGEDVAKKLLILTRRAGFNVNMSDIERESFIEESYLKEKDVKRFLESLSNFDNKPGQGSEFGKVLRYIASMHLDSDEQPILQVKPRYVSKNSRLGRLEGTANGVTITSDKYPASTPWYHEVPGAGPEVTASNLRSNLLDRLGDSRSVSYSDNQ